MRRAVTAVASAVVFAAAAIAAAGAPAAGARLPIVKPAVELAVLLQAHRALPLPDARPSRARLVAAWRPITGGQTVLPVIGRRTGDGGVRWLRVRVPGRPNGGAGWIVQRGTTRETTPWHIVARTSSRRVLVFRRARLVRSFSVVVGKRSTPTPHGRFFVEESVRMLPGSAGAPYALALSARSNVLQEFAGGPGQIAIHGVANLGGTPGTAASHGCIRVPNAQSRWLAARIAPGTPVTITS
ncbi:MAG TPA: L,D-transpeptidase [Solirubrobacteraceae bacterium]|nr:L,D-transpeptidase [Solirubrobacteraceae bacterium]